MITYAHTGLLNFALYLFSPGIDQPYDRPDNPELCVKTVSRSVRDCVQDVLDVMAANNIVSNDVKEDYADWYRENEKVTPTTISGRIKMTKN